jgi:hypothetical protein
MIADVDYDPISTKSKDSRNHQATTFVADHAAAAEPGITKYHEYAVASPLAERSGSTQFDNQRMH